MDASQVKQLRPVRMRAGKMRRTLSYSVSEEHSQKERKERIHRADKPIHSSADSLFSGTSGFTNYVGMLNLACILLVMTCTRIALENVIKYGILFSPIGWVKVLIEQPYSWPCLTLLIGCNIFILCGLWIEKLIYSEIISEKVTKYLHIVNDLLVICLPAIVILRVHPNPGFSSATLAIYTCVFLKLISYQQVNSWCRRERKNSFKRRRSRKQSLNIADNLEQHSDSEIDQFHVPNGIIPHHQLQVYPDNLNLKDMYYFMIVPTLSYELNFPRSARIRKRFLLKRILEMVFLSGLIMALLQQWIAPTVLNSMTPFQQMKVSIIVERLLKLALPNFLIWLTFFYWFFHSCLNVLAELTMFGDRIFYKDWWNAETVGYFWSNWNIPVHRWAVRHLYKPLLNYQHNKMIASTSVFIVSAFFHEYLVSIPLRMFRLWAFMAMLFQVPFALFANKYLHGKMGNIAVWLSLIVGQPAAILMYYHDYYIDNFTS